MGVWDIVVIIAGMYKIRTRPPKYEAVEVFIAVGEKYFAMCELLQQRPTVVGLALYLGYVSRQTIYDIAKGKQSPEFSYAATQLVARCEAGLCLESRTEFLLKNHHDYVEKQELKHEGGIKIVPLDDKDRQA